jgi:hypothetical protein
VGDKALFWLRSYVTSHHLVALPQSSAKHQFYSAVCYITLLPICVAQRISKNLKNIVEYGVRKPELKEK